ncbi:hypothetical protein [Pseudoalteromonas piscicida]
MKTRNQRYEQKQKDRGLNKVTLWVPCQSEVEIRQMIEFLTENPDHIPYMARSLKTGKMRKIT